MARTPEDIAREHVYAAERALPAMERHRVVSDDEARDLVARHIGVRPDIVSTDQFGDQLTGQWFKSARLGRVPLITRPRGYPLGRIEVAHEAAHLVVTQHGDQPSMEHPMRGHHAAFRQVMLGTVPERVRPHLGAQFTERFGR